MSIQLSWHSSPSASCFHATAALLRQQSIHDELVACLAEGAEELRVQLAADGISCEAFFEHLIPNAARIESNLQLAETTITKILGRDAAQSCALPYRGLLSDLEHAFDAQVPDLSPLAGSLAGSLAALRQAVETIVPGVVNHLAAWTEPQMVVEQAEVVGLYPALGGGGAAHLAYNSVSVEVVPRDPVAALPESTRVVWLLSLLNLDLPRYSDHLRPGRSHLVEHLAMIPPVLQALGECGANADTCDLQLAIETWIDDARETAEVAARLDDWWQVYLAQRPHWPAALEALDQLLNGVLVLEAIPVP